MTRLPRAALAVYLLSAITSTAMAQSAPTSVQVAGPITTLDCYDTLGSNSDTEENYTFQTDGHCQEVCTAKGAKVMITSGGNACFCGDYVPAASHKIDESECNIPCGGYPQQNCGGLGTYQYYLTSLGAPTVEKDNTTSSAKPSQTQTPSSTASPVVVTESATAPPPSSGGGSSKVAVAVGVVVGVIAVAAIAGAGVFFWKRRRNQQLKEEHARNAALSGLVKGTKTETSSPNDSRLDPSIYSARRDSLGSIADERDFSRRILQVRNPDRESRASHV